MEKSKIISRAARFRRELGEDLISPIDIFSLALTIPKLTLFLYPLGPRISGMCAKAADICVIAINSGMSKGRQRFTLAHELYHFKYESENSISICSVKFSAANDDGIEHDADRFASYLLLPPGSFEDKIEEVKKEYSTLRQTDLIPLEQLYGLSHQAMLWRLTNDGIISPAENLSLKEGVISTARRLGYDISLYKPVPDDLAERKVLGHYIQVAEDLFAKEAISSGKYDELLLAGYRSDIVYGDEEGDLIAD